jgi:mono/diheme cytochrome c family protein
MAAACTNLEVAVPPVTTLRARGGHSAILESGRRIYLEKCSRCHVAEPVRDYPAARWPGIIADMGERAKLSEEQHRQVLAYVLAASQ